MINPAGIPTIPGDMDALAGHAAALGGVGSDFAGTGAQVNAIWQGLGGVYDAPEAAQLLAATAPVQTLSASVGHDIGTVATVLSVYAAEVREIKTQLTVLSSQASAFVDENGGSDDWCTDDAKVERNKSLVEGVNAQLAAFSEAQRRCANAINALYGGPQYTADNGDGQHQPGEHGYTADQLNTAARADGVLPWGSVDERDRGLLGDIGAFCGGIKDGAVGFVTGLGALIGRDPTTGGWSWATAGTAWQGLGTFALAVGVYAVPGGMQLDQAIGIPGFDRGAMGDTLLTAGKSIIAYDEWGNDPARAAGMATFNVVSAIVGTKGATAGLRTAGTAAQGSRVAAVSATGTAMVRTSEAIGRMPTVSELAGRATARLPGLHLPNLSNTAHINIPHHVDIPTPRTHADVPTGTHLPSGAHLPDTPPHPGTVGDALSHTPAGHPDAGPAHPADIPGPRAANTATAHVNGHADAPTDSHPHTDAYPADHAGDTADHHGEADATLTRHEPSPLLVSSHPDPSPHIPEPLHRDEPLPTRDLQNEYAGENDPTNPHRAFHPDVVEYMSPQRLEEHRLVVMDGKLHWAADGALFDTRAATTHWSGQGRAMFVMDQHGNLYASLQQEVGRLHHSSFLGGKPVAGAGEIVVEDGVPTMLSRKSGHYQPSAMHHQQVRDMLDEQGIDVSDVTFEDGF